LELKPGYKQTEVGVIPDDWDVKPLHALADKIMVGIASAATHAYRDRGIVMFRNQNIKPSHLDDSDILFLDGKYELSFKNKRLKSGDLLTARTGYPGTTSIVPPQYEGAQSFTTLITRPRRNLVDSAYLCCLINSETGQSYFDRNQAGGGQKNVNAGSLKYLPVPLPPTRAEQEAIAKALSDADALIESLEQLIAKKRHLKQGAMQELLTGKKRLPGFSGEWGMHHLSRFVQNFIVPMRDKPKDLTGEIPWCRIEDFDGIYLSGSKSGQGVDIQTVRTMNLKVYSTGTLLVSCSADLGRCAIVSRPLVSNQTFIGLEMNETVSSTLFFYYYMTSKAEELNNLSSGTTISYLSREQFEDLDVCVPVGEQEQTAIATILSDMDAEIAALEAKLAKARQLKQGMMQELLTGKVRLV
jgi:type I restriction enzyme, S subunit